MSDLNDPYRPPSGEIADKISAPPLTDRERSLVFTFYGALLLSIGYVLNLVAVFALSIPNELGRRITIPTGIFLLFILLASALLVRAFLIDRRSIVNWLIGGTIPVVIVLRSLALFG